MLLFPPQSKFHEKVLGAHAGLVLWRHHILGYPRRADHYYYSKSQKANESNEPSKADDCYDTERLVSVMDVPIVYLLIWISFL